MLRQLCQLLQLQPGISSATSAALACSSIHLLSRHPAQVLSLTAVWQYHRSHSTSNGLQDGERTLHAPPAAAQPATAEPEAAGSVENADDRRHRSKKKQKRQLVKPEDAQPVLFTHKILKTVMTSTKPPNSHELWEAVQEQYPGDFRSRRFFKSHLQYLQKSRLVKVASPALVGIGRPGEPYVYLPSQSGQQVDLNAEAYSALQVKARQLADVWTEENLPQYAAHVREGRIALTVENQGLVGNPPKDERFMSSGAVKRRELQMRQQQERQQQQQEHQQKRYAVVGREWTQAQKSRNSPKLRNRR